MSAMSIIASTITAISMAITSLFGSSLPSTDNPVPNDVVVREDLADLQPRAWQSHEKVGDDQVRIFFIGGACSEYQVKVTESDFSVKIDLYEGVAPDTPDECILVGVQYSMLVQLEKPLGNRIVRQTPALLLR